jgi:ATP-dependent exoDNAse (exonuclease V) beta subunit
LAARSGADLDRHIPKGAQARSRVNLVGVHGLVEQEQSVRLSDDERHDLVRDNMRRLYMALTRAGHRVVLTYVGEPPEAVLQCLGSPSAARADCRPRPGAATR